MGNSIEELRNGFETAYIDGAVVSSEKYRPQFISNNYKEGKKVLSSIEDELLRCDEFRISVAFITLGGITPLLQTLKELEKKTPVAEQNLMLPAETDYLRHKTLIALPALERGFYFLMGNISKDNKNEDKMLVLNFQVSSLSFVTNDHVGLLDIVVLDRKTGKLNWAWNNGKKTC